MSLLKMAMQGWQLNSPYITAQRLATFQTVCLAMEYLIQTGSNVGTVQLPSLHSHFYLGQLFFVCLFSLLFFLI